MTELDEQVQRYGSKGDKATITRWILWGALLLSHLVMAGIAAFLRATVGEENQPAPIEIQITMSAAALSCLVVVGLAPRLFARLDPTAFQLVRWSLAETLTIFAVVLGSLGARWELLGALVGIGLVAHVLLRPDS